METNVQGKYYNIKYYYVNSTLKWQNRNLRVGHYRPAGKCRYVHCTTHANYDTAVIFLYENDCNMPANPGKKTTTRKTTTTARPSFYNPNQYANSWSHYPQYNTNVSDYLSDNQLKQIISHTPTIISMLVSKLDNRVSLMKRKSEIIMKNSWKSKWNKSSTKCTKILFRECSDQM